MKKRLSAFLVAMAMIFGVLPITALAEGQPECICKILCDEVVNTECEVCNADKAQCIGEPEEEEPEEQPECICKILCDEAVNTECEVCNADKAQCTGEPEEEEPETSTCTCNTKCGEDGNPTCGVCKADPTKCESKPEQTEDEELDDAFVLNLVEKINALPTPEEITEETNLDDLKEQIASIRNAYNALTDEQKAAFDTVVLDKLTALEAKISELESGEQETAPSEAVQNVIEKIDAAVELIDYTTETIPATDGTTVTKTHITMLKDLDPANNEELKALIDKEAAHEHDENQPALTDEEAAKLSDARKVFEDAKAKYMTEGFSDAQLAARSSYDAMTDEEQVKVTNYNLLVDMEANIGYIMQAVNVLPEQPNFDKVWLAGQNIAAQYRTNDRPNPSYDPRNNTNINFLSQLEKIIFSFADGFNKDLYVDTGFYSYDKNKDSYDEFVKNPNDNRTWQCVGFIPYKNGYLVPAELKDLSPYVYTETPLSTGEGKVEPFKKGSLDDAIKAVQDAGGVLYGTQPTSENIDAFRKNIYKPSKTTSQLTLVCVWYVSSVDELEHGEYDNLTIPPVSAVDYQPTSAGVSFSCGEATYNYSSGEFNVDIQIDISETAPNQLHINLNDILGEAMEKINKADGNNQVQPGDKMIYSISVRNHSNKNYSYINNSVELGTVQLGGTGALGTGFDGYVIHEIGDEGYSPIPHRNLNPALKALGLSTDLSDSAVGAALKKKNYGSATDDDSTVAQKYLSHYYLDYLNQTRTGEENPKAKSFYDLNSSEFSMLTNTTGGGGCSETCPEVAEAFYYFYYGHIYSFNGMSLYEQMKNSSQLNTDFQDALTQQKPFVLTTALDGERMNNAFQNTSFAFGMQFDMSTPVVPTDPDPDPIPTPTPETDEYDDYVPYNDDGEEVTIEDEVVPLADLPDDEVPLADLPDEEVPLKNNPETGSTSTAPAVALAVVSLTALAVLTKKR